MDANKDKSTKKTIKKITVNLVVFWGILIGISWLVSKNVSAYSFAKFGGITLVKYMMIFDSDLLERIDSMGDTALQDAAFNGDARVVKILIFCGANVNVSGAGGSQPIHRAAYDKDPEIINIIINSGGNVNALNYDLETPIHCAAELGRKYTLLALIEAGAYVNPLDCEGRSALDKALAEGHEEVVAILRKHGGKTGREAKEALGEERWQKLWEALKRKPPF